MKTLKKITATTLCILMLFSFMSIGTMAAGSRRIDLAFVIDTTGSMSDDIYEVKTNMTNYLNDLNDSGIDYRIAIVEYRDFSSRTGESEDFPYRVTLNFSSDYRTITNSINSVDLGNGGDWEETLYSALIDGLDELNWRDSSGKAAIIMGDAPALDPEPITGYTLEMVKNKMLYNKIGLSDERYARGIFTDSRSPITLFTIATSGNSATKESFSALAEATNGKSYTAYDSAEISEIISDIVTEELPDVNGGEKSFLLSFLEGLANIFVNIFYIITFQWDLISW